MLLNSNSYLLLEFFISLTLLSCSLSTCDNLDSPIFIKSPQRPSGFLSSFSLGSFLALLPLLLSPRLKFQNSWPTTIAYGLISSSPSSPSWAFHMSFTIFLLLLSQTSRETSPIKSLSKHSMKIAVRDLPTSHSTSARPSITSLIPGHRQNKLGTNFKFNMGFKVPWPPSWIFKQYSGITLTSHLLSCLN